MYFLTHLRVKALARNINDTAGKPPERILPEDLPESVLEAQATVTVPATKYHEAVVETKKQIILGAMQQAKGSYTDAAKILGVHPNYLHRLIRNLNLKEQLKK